MLNNLAQIYEAQGRYGGMETLALRAFDMVTKSLGPGNPDTAKVMRKLGITYRDTWFCGRPLTFQFQYCCKRGQSRHQRPQALRVLIDVYRPGERDGEEKKRFLRIRVARSEARAAAPASRPRCHDGG